MKWKLCLYGVDGIICNDIALHSLYGYRIRYVISMCVISLACRVPPPTPMPSAVQHLLLFTPAAVQSSVVAKLTNLKEDSESKP